MTIRIIVAPKHRFSDVTISTLVLFKQFACCRRCRSQWRWQIAILVYVVVSGCALSAETSKLVGVMFGKGNGLTAGWYADAVDGGVVITGTIFSCTRRKRGLHIKFKESLFCLSCLCDRLGRLYYATSLMCCSSFDDANDCPSAAKSSWFHCGSDVCCRRAVESVARNALWWAGTKKIKCIVYCTLVRVVQFLVAFNTTYMLFRIYYIYIYCDVSESAAQLFKLSLVFFFPESFFVVTHFCTIVYVNTFWL